MNRLYDYLSENPRLRVYLPLKLYWLLIFVLTTIPGHALPKTIKLGDKIEHLLAYFGLSVLLFLTVHFKYEFSVKKISFIVITVVALYGAFDEIHQLLIPFRSADWLDFFADVLGGIIGILIMRFFFGIISKNC